MSKIERYSTRMRGFHVRNYRVAGGDDSEMFSAELFLHDERIGFIRNHGHGGPDIVDVMARHSEWRAFAAYIHEHPTLLEEDGEPSEYTSPDEAASAFLRTMAMSEDALRRSRKYQSGVMGHVWGEPYPGMEHWAAIDPVQIFWGVPGLDPETMLRELDASTFWIVVLGQDNADFLRPDRPPRPGTRR